MSCNWPNVTLQEVTSRIGDGLHGTPKYDESGEYYFINGNNLSDGEIVITEKTKRTSKEEYEKHKKNLNDRTIIVSINGTLGNIAVYNGEKVFLGKSACYLNVNEDVDKFFIKYVLDSQIFQNYIHNLATGSTIKNASLKLMREFDFKLPPLNVQRSIAGILKNLSDRIRLNNQINQTLEQIAQALFKSWFVDFEPTKAKIAALESGGSEKDALLAAMQAISGTSLFDAGASAAGAEEQLTRLQAERPEQYAELRATAELFPSAMQDSELGEIPVGWEVDSLASKIDVFNGFAFKSGDYVKQPGIFVLRTKNFNNENIAVRLSDDVFLPEGFGSSHKKYLCEAYDYHLIMVGASVGKTGIIFPCNLPALRNQNMWCFRPKFGARIGKAFTKHMLDELVSQKVGLASGSAREFFRKGDFQNQTICFGSEHIQNSFHSIVFSLLEKQAINVAENGCLSALRDALLPKLLSGELPMTDTDARLAKVEEPVDV